MRIEQLNQILVGSNLMVWTLEHVCSKKSTLNVVLPDSSTPGQHVYDARQTISRRYEFQMKH